MYFRITKSVYLHAGLLFIFFCSFFTPTARLYPITYFFAVLHEGFHYAAARILHVPVSRITLLPYGCHLRLERTDFCAEAKIAAAGPLGSFLLFLLFRGSQIGNINLMLSLFNLLPALPLDGGRLFRLILWRTRGVFLGNRILRRAGRYTGACLLILSVCHFSLPTGYVGAMLLCHARDITASPSFSQKKTVRTQAVKLFYAQSTDSLLHLSHFYSPFYHALFYIPDRKCLLTERAVTFHLSQNAAARVSDIL